MSSSSEGVPGDRQVVLAERPLGQVADHRAGGHGQHHRLHHLEHRAEHRCELVVGILTDSQPRVVTKIELAADPTRSTEPGHVG